MTVTYNCDLENPCFYSGDSSDGLPISDNIFVVAPGTELKSSSQRMVCKHTSGDVTDTLHCATPVDAVEFPKGNGHGQFSSAVEFWCGEEDTKGEWKSRKKGNDTLWKCA